MTLLDSVNKKVRATNGFIERLDLQGIRAVWGRAEELNRQAQYRGRFMTVVSRATAYLPQLLEWGLPFLHDNGALYAYKLPNRDEMADAEKFLRKTPFAVTAEMPYTLAGQERVIWEVRRK